MSSSSSSALRRTASRGLFIITLLAAVPVFAGPPLICHPFKAGDTSPLPGGSDNHGTSARYDRSSLVADTLAALTPERPILTRMETVRRATIYATDGLKGRYAPEEKQLAFALLEKLRERTTTADDAGRALALFDLGFYSECLRQARVSDRTDGYDLLVKADQLRGGDPEIQFALALAANLPKRADQVEHLNRARAGAKEGTLLAVNLASHFGGR